MTSYYHEDAEKLIGEVLESIDYSSNDDDIILFRTKSGKTFQMYHQQDCCENVHMEDLQGNWADLVGKVVRDVTVDSGDLGEPPSDSYNDSFTRTHFRFVVDDATVISKWIGTSNGYYSEEVSFKELKNFIG